jgi:hypothetical protein
MAYVIPTFYFHTASDVLAIPEPVQQGGSVEPHTTQVNFVSIPTLQTYSQNVVVTLVISGTILQSRVAQDGAILVYSTILYTPAPQSVLDNPGVIYMKLRPGYQPDTLRLGIMSNLNYPDYEVQSYVENPPSAVSGQKTVVLADDYILRFPVREIQRVFSTLFGTSDTLIAPNIATFTGFRSQGSPPVTVYISLPVDAYSLLNLSASSGESLSGNLVLQTSDPPADPIKMTGSSWTVVGIIWGLTVLSAVISILIAYRWYLRSIL